MITGLIRRQELILSSPMIVADTIDYLTAQFVFQTGDWDGAVKYSHWSNGEVTYDLPLTDDKIDESAHLNLSAGVWKVYIHGEKYADGNMVQRITTCEANLTVKSTGAIGGEVFPQQPAGEIERIHAQLAGLAREKISLPTDDGGNAINGTSGQYAVSDGAGGVRWEDASKSAGGAIWYPTVTDGVISWVKSESDTAPESADIRGNDGKSAYEIAVANGFVGTEAEWLESLAGEHGADGITPHIGDNGNWYIGETDTGIMARGEKGDAGDNYVLTEADKTEIAQAAAELVDSSLLGIIGEVS